MTTAVDQGIDPRSRQPVGDPVPHTPPDRLDEACQAAAAAAGPLRATPADERADLLQAVATALEGERKQIVRLADAETGLGKARLTGELTRTRAQLEMFADAVLEGSYTEAIIDLPDQAAQPAPRPDLRRMLVPLGPVAVFAASNFPLAFSVAGGDTASALAAGCPVVVKAHPGHPGTSVLCGQIVDRALAAAGAPDGTFAVVHGEAVGRDLVTHPAISAVGFTGSLTGGRALADLCASRPDPIPFYGELGSLNPVVVTPGALADRRDDLVAGFVGSYLLGSGQFCTKPGLLFVPAGHGLTDALTAAVAAAPIGPLLGDRIQQGYSRAIAKLAGASGVRAVIPPVDDPAGVRPALLAVSATALTGDAGPLLEECFGPGAVLVEYTSTEELLAALERLPGSLTASLHADPRSEAELCRSVLELATAKAGRVIWNGWPTGVAVTWAMHHGGPWPATTAPLHTSVGVTAIRRWLRPVAYQDVPDELLPEVLRDANPLGVPRRVNGELTAAPIDRSALTDR